MERAAGNTVCGKAGRLRAMVRLYMTNASLSPMTCADAWISRVGQDLFGSAMSHGGRFKGLVERRDRLLCGLIQG